MSLRSDELSTGRASSTNFEDQQNKTKARDMENNTKRRDTSQSEKIALRSIELSIGKAALPDSQNQENITKPRDIGQFEDKTSTESPEEDNSPERLRANLETLPQELYDITHTNVFTADPGMRDITGSHDKQGAQKHRDALKLLQVSQSTRAQYAKTYYGPGAHFIIKHKHPRITGPILMSWAKSLPASKLHTPARITVVFDPSKVYKTDPSKFYKFGATSLDPRSCALLYIKMWRDQDMLVGSLFGGKTSTFCEWELVGGLKFVMRSMNNLTHDEVVEYGVLGESRG